MSLEICINEAIKKAMLAKEADDLRALRAIKSAILLAKTANADSEVKKAEEVKILQKLIKQRTDARAIYNTQGRSDLAEKEETEIKVISRFLPPTLSIEALTTLIRNTIKELGITDKKEMGKIIAAVQKATDGNVNNQEVVRIIQTCL